MFYNTKLFKKIIILIFLTLIKKAEIIPALCLFIYNIGNCLVRREEKAELLLEYFSCYLFWYATFFNRLTNDNINKETRPYNRIGVSHTMK